MCYISCFPVTIAEDYIGNALGFLRVGIDIENDEPYLYATLDEMPGLLATGKNKYELLDELVDCFIIRNQLNKERKHEV